VIEEMREIAWRKPAEPLREITLRRICRVTNVVPKPEI
jgi:hypothetical protein